MYIHCSLHTRKMYCTILNMHSWLHEKTTILQMLFWSNSLFLGLEVHCYLLQLKHVYDLIICSLWSTLLVCNLHIMEIIRKKLKIFKLVGYYRKKLKVSILVPYELKNILTRLGNLDDQGLMILSLPLWTSDVDQMLIRYSTIWYHTSEFT